MSGARKITERTDPDRRTLLGLATGAAIAAPMALNRPAGPPPEEDAATDGYRETDHIRAAYARMRF